MLGKTHPRTPFRLQVESFGVGNSVKLPGPSAALPNRYRFDSATYQDIFDDLQAKNAKLYSENGLLDLMKRNVGVKRGPQRWQDRPPDMPPFDCVVTFERKVWEIVVADMRKREAENGGCHPCVVINLEVKDSPAEAATAAHAALQMCRWIDEAEDWEAEIDSILDRFAEETGRPRPEHDWCFS